MMRSFLLALALLTCTCRRVSDRRVNMTEEPDAGSSHRGHGGSEVAVVRHAASGGASGSQDGVKEASSRVRPGADGADAIPLQESGPGAVVVEWLQRFLSSDADAVAALSALPIHLRGPVLGDKETYRRCDIGADGDMRRIARTRAELDDSLRCLRTFPLKLLEDELESARTRVVRSSDGGTRVTLRVADGGGESIKVVAHVKHAVVDSMDILYTFEE